MDKDDVREKKNEELKNWDKIDRKTWQNDKGFHTDQVNIWKQSGKPKYQAEYTKDVTSPKPETIKIAEANMFEEVKQRALNWMKTHP